MAYPFTLDDVRFLTSPAGRDALDAAAGLRLTEATLLADLTKLRRTVGERSAAVAETIRLRRRADGQTGRDRRAVAVHRRVAAAGQPGRGGRAPGGPAEPGSACTT